MSQHSVYIFSSELNSTVWYTVSICPKYQAVRAAEQKIPLAQLEFETVVADPFAFKMIMKNPTIVNLLKCPVSKAGVVSTHHVPKEKLELLKKIVARAVTIPAYADTVVSTLQANAPADKLSSKHLQELGVSIETELGLVDPMAFGLGSSFTAWMDHSKTVSMLTRLLHPVQYIQHLISLIPDNVFVEWAQAQSARVTGRFEIESLVKILTLVKA